MAVTGVAQTNERVSELLRNTLYNSPWLETPELIEIKAATVQPGQTRPARLFDFSMRVTIKRPQARGRRQRAAAGAPRGRAPSSREDARWPRPSSIERRSEQRVRADAAAQFRGLQSATSPASGRCCPSCRLCAAGVLAASSCSAGSCCCSGQTDELEAERDRGADAQARTTAASSRQAVNLASCASRSCRSRSTSTQLEKQLPGKAEMDALLSDINQAGLGRGLQFELFRPGQVVGARTTTPSCRSPSRSAAATTTSAPSPPTWPTCRASSRCTT